MHIFAPDNFVLTINPMVLSYTPIIKEIQTVLNDVKLSFQIGQPEIIPAFAALHIESIKPVTS